MARRARPSTVPQRPPTDADRIVGDIDASLLDVVDNVLNLGVVLTGDVVLGLAGVDLIYARISALLCAADRVFPPDVTAKGPRRRIGQRAQGSVPQRRLRP